jgi:excisionase family DNA binding protein
VLTVADVAAALRVCTATVRALCRRGELAHFRVSNAIRVRPEDLEAFLRRMEE